MTAPQPHVVVGVCLHDDDAALRRSLPSAVHQRFPGSVDVLVIDDGAGDAARRTLAELGDRYANVAVHRNPTRLGRAASRNQALAMAGAGFIAWMDLGDVWHPRKLAIQHATLSSMDPPDAALVTGPHRLVDAAEGSERRVVPDLGDQPLLALARRQVTIPGGTLFGTVAAHRLVGGFDQTLPYRDDEELLLRFLTAGGHLIASDGVVLSTGSVVRDRPTARQAAIADRRIRRVHGDTLRAADASGARRAHRRELQRVARLHGKEGRRIRAGVYRLRADAVAAADRLARTVVRRAEDPVAASATDPPQPPATVDDRRDARPSPGDTAVAPALVGVHRAAEQSAWPDALAAWNALAETVRADADPISFELIARSHRALDQHRAAIAIASTGLERWPDHPRIGIELAKSRAATTDWSTAVRATSSGVTAEELGTERHPGVVTSLGVLAGGDGPVTGWMVAAPSGLPVEVALQVDDTTVVTTYAQAPGPEGPGTLAFAISCEQLLEFLGDGDRITVTADGATLPIAGFGPAAEVRTGYPSRVEALRARLDDGAVFTKFGRLRPGYTPAKKRRMLDLVDEVAAVVEDAHGYTCTPFYGNLLGAVREQDFIAHDVGGFDVGYVTRESEPATVRAEFLDICRRLLDRGFHLEIEPFAATIRRDPGDRMFVDLNYAWWTPDEQLQLSFGWRDTPATGRQRVMAPRDTYLAGRLVRIPGDAEAVLHQVYGDGWAIPDQGFDVAHRLVRDEAFLLTDTERETLRSSAPDRVRVL